MHRSTCSNLCCGVGGGFICVAALIYLGVPVLVAGLHWVGLSLAAAGPTLLLLALVATAISVFGLWLAFGSHRRPEPMALGTVGGAVMLLGFLIWQPAAALGLLMLLAAIALSTYHTRRAVLHTIS
jgi:hypothetical protein